MKTVVPPFPMWPVHLGKPLSRNRSYSLELVVDPALLRMGVLSAKGGDQFQHF